MGVRTAWRVTKERAGGQPVEATGLRAYLKAGYGGGDAAALDIRGGHRLLAGRSRARRSRGRHDIERGDRLPEPATRRQLDSGEPGRGSAKSDRLREPQQLPGTERGRPWRGPVAARLHTRGGRPEQRRGSRGRRRLHRNVEPVGWSAAPPVAAVRAALQHPRFGGGARLFMPLPGVALP